MTSHHDTMITLGWEGGRLCTRKAKEAFGLWEVAVGI